MWLTNIQQDLSFFNNLHSYASEKLKTVYSEYIPILHIKRMNAQQAPPSHTQKQSCLCQDILRVNHAKIKTRVCMNQRKFLVNAIKNSTFSILNLTGYGEKTHHVVRKRCCHFGWRFFIEHFPTFSRILRFLRFSPVIRTIKTIIKNNVTFQINQQPKVLGQTSSA